MDENMERRLEAEARRPVKDLWAIARNPKTQVVENPDAPQLEHEIRDVFLRTRLF